MKYTFLFLSLLFIAACGSKDIEGSGAINSQSRTVSEINKIHVGANIKAVINVQPGAEASVTISGYENLLAHVLTEMDGTTLNITTPDHENLISDQDLLATITVASLEELDLSGASDAVVNGTIAVPEFALDISGSGSANIMDVRAKEMNVSLSGNGKAIIENGEVADLNYDLSGSGIIDAFGLKGKNVDAEVSGAGKIKLSALSKLKADVSGAGNISYKGFPSIESNTSGVGTISSAN